MISYLSLYTCLVHAIMRCIVKATIPDYVACPALFVASIYMVCYVRATALVSPSTWHRLVGHYTISNLMFAIFYFSCVESSLIQD